MVIRCYNTAEEPSDLSGRVGNKIRFCHADHLLRHARTVEKHSDVIDVWSETTATPSDESDGESVGTSTLEIPEQGVNNACSPSSGESLRRSTREIHAPPRLIEEL